VIDLYRQQTVVKNAGGKMEEEDDFY